MSERFEANLSKSPTSDCIDVTEDKRTEPSIGSQAQTRVSDPLGKPTTVQIGTFRLRPTAALISVALN